MSIGLDADGNNGGHGTHVSLLVYLLRGEFDERIKWPFRGSVIIQLLNERRDGGHYEAAIMKQPWNSQMKPHWSILAGWSRMRGELGGVL